MTSSRVAPRPTVAGVSAARIWAAPVIAAPSQKEMQKRRVNTPPFIGSGCEQAMGSWLPAGKNTARMLAQNTRHLTAPRGTHGCGELRRETFQHPDTANSRSIFRAPRHGHHLRMGDARNGFRTRSSPEPNVRIW